MRNSCHDMVVVKEPKGHIKLSWCQGYLLFWRSFSKDVIVLG